MIVASDTTLNGTDGDSACTSEQIKDKDVITAYTCGSQEMCSQMAAAPTVYKNLLCCASDDCNNGAAGLAVSFVGIFALIAMLL